MKPSVKQPQPPTGELNSSVYTMQIVAGAMIVIPVIFAIAIVASRQGLEEGSSAYIVSIISATLGASTLVMRLFISDAMERSENDEEGIGDDLPDDEEGLLSEYRLQMIVSLGMLMGAACLNVFAVMMENHWWSLLIAGMLVFAMATSFPSHSKVRAWIDSVQKSRAVRKADAERTERPSA